MYSESQLAKVVEEQKCRSVKCVIWDLDDTLWEGVLLEDSHVTLRPFIVTVLQTLDERGILHSIASKNDHQAAMGKLKDLGIADYFLYPEIGWSSKSSGVRAIARSLNIATDTVAFIDDQAFEREEVGFSVPDVLCIDAGEIRTLLDRPELNPRFITEDSRCRRRMYLDDVTRNKAEKEFVGPQEDFLATLGMRFILRPSREEDLQRAHELTLRTHQLNTTGYTYSYEELNRFRQSDQHILLVASLTDKFGSYGKIGLALVELEERFWTLKLLLMSCRVMSRGVGTIMVNYILRLAKKADVPLRADFILNSKNRMMYITYKFSNFRVVEERGDLVIFENDCSRIQEFPSYVHVDCLD